MEEKNIFNKKFTQNVKNLDKSGLLLYNDSRKHDIVYLIQQNKYYIMKSKTYEIIRTIPNIEKPRLLSFRYKEKDYLMAYDKKSFVLYPYESSDKSIQYLFRFTDDIVNIYNINIVKLFNPELFPNLSEQLLNIYYDRPI